ncbi:glycine zipper 2TM domain-containing protein [Delftia sp. PS-11]|uniref:glycine zipper 2TM domain-containing protein n=1 Tax=Delftia sp. PS-11 TaxID=2767222 RepID=UPI0024573CAA|nr:glycine zipper 2TM domain-containing protein [Delftia sp. PS-11]KAJ8745150.1 glycine zipper 2TM domain-containing protein [Delftia sp. PS-11]
MQKMNTRFGRTLVMVTAVAGALALGGCAHRPNNAQLGTGVGAVAGGVLGNAVFGSTLGTVGGAAAGALIGNEMGKNSDRAGRRRY